MHIFTPPPAYLRRAIAYSPFLAFALKGITNGWNPFIVGGMLITYYFAYKTQMDLSYYKANQLYKISVNKKISKLKLTIPNNWITQKLEDALVE